MSLRPILRWPDDALCRPCAPIAAIDDAVQALAADLLDTMYAAPGRGLAAPQVGQLRRMLVMDATWKDGTPGPVVMINPAVTAVADAVAVHDESCLSIPGVVAAVTRPVWVRVVWTGLDGAECSGAFEGIAAAIVQHELDHLDGIVTFDRLSGADRAVALKAYAG